MLRPRRSHEKLVSCRYRWLIVALNLRIAGHVPVVVHDGELAIAELLEKDYDLVLLNINLPKKSGLEVLSAVREDQVDVPIIILSARHGEFDKVGALRLGADDYVTKPFALAELMARVEAVLRRTQRKGPIGGTASAASKLHFGQIEIDTSTRTVMRDGAEVKLTHLEFELLEYFVRNPSQVFARADILRAVWGRASGTLRTVDNFVGQLRTKLEDDPESPVHFVTVRGAGYRFDPTASH